MSGRVIGTHGFYVDVTNSARERETSITAALAKIVQGRALIEQVKGVLMAVYSIDADAAFDMLRAALTKLSWSGNFSATTRLKVDDSVPRAERLVRPSDVFESRGDVRVVIRMLMGQHEARCRVRGTGLIPVHSFDLGGPVPSLVVKVEAK